LLLTWCPGIAKLTIADDAVVDEADLGVSFFLDEDCLGKCRAECSAKLLQELNPEVQCNWYPKKAVRSRHFPNYTKYVVGKLYR
jgi:molybdopterin/thiamine biosynthesis adenylyltransferase